MNTKLLKHNLTILCGIFFIGICTESCKKDYPSEKNSLSGDTSIFVGTWNWIYTNHDCGFCQNQYFQDQYTPATESTMFSLVFVSSGIVCFYKQDTLISEHRIIFNKFNLEPEHCMIYNAHSFHVYLDGNGKTSLAGCINQDTMRLSLASGFLFNPESGCEIYQNYFLKQ